MINVDSFIKKLEDLKPKINKYIDDLAFSYLWHIRIIVPDEEGIFGKRREYYKALEQNIEVSSVPWYKHEKRGWSKPDLQFGDVEIRYLWKQFRPSNNQEL